MAARLREIFDHPEKPESFSQEQFDGAQSDLIRTASKEWYEIDRSDYWHYLLDLCYVDLDQQLFDHVFPGFLIRWWEGQVNRKGGPNAECDFYRAIDQGEILTKMIPEARRQKVFAWMIDAYIDGVDLWGGNLSTHYASQGPDNLHAPLWSFNAIGQSVPITSPILEKMSEIKTEGRAQWWLVLATGLVWNENESPFIPPWTSESGGGGVYVIESATSIFGHGYLHENLDGLRKRLDFDLLLRSLKDSKEFLDSSAHRLWLADALSHVQRDPDRITQRIDQFCRLLGQPDLGGVLTQPLETSE